MAVELFANTPSTSVLSGGTDAPASGTQETWMVASPAEFPAASATAVPPTQFHVGDPAAPAEIIAVTNVSGTTWTVTRGAESTTPLQHLADFTVWQVASAGVYGSFAQPATTPPGNTVFASGDETGAADQAAITAAEALGKTVYYAPGTFWVTGLTKQAGTIWQGSGRDLTTIKLVAGADTDVVQSQGFSSLTLSGSATGGIGGWGIRDLTIDGNESAQSGTSYGLRVFGYDFDLCNVSIRNCLSWGLYTEWGGGFTGPGPDLTEEARYYGLKVYSNGQGGWHDRGPHDSRSYDVTVSGNGSGYPNYWAETCGPGTSVAAGSNGVDLSTFTSGLPGTLDVSTTLGYPAASISAAQGSLIVATAMGNVTLTYTGTTAATFTGCAAQDSPASGSTVSTGGTVSPQGPTGHCYGCNGNLHEAMHCYGSGASWQYQLDGQVQLTGCVFEVAATGMCLMRYPGSQVNGGWMFVLSGASQTGCGVQLGDAANGAQQMVVRCAISNLANTSPSTASVVISNDQTGNDIDVFAWAPGSPTTVWTGTPTRESRVRIQVAGQSRALNDSLSYYQIAGVGQWDIPSSTSQAWTLTVAGTDVDNIDTNVSPFLRQHPNGTTDVWYAGNYVAPSLQVNGASGHLLPRSGSSNSLTPSVANGSNCTAGTISANASDTAGAVSGTMIASPAAGSLLTITYKTSWGNHPIVTLTPATAAAAQIETYITTGFGFFTIGAAVAPPGTVGSQAVSWNYMTLGQDS